MKTLPEILDNFINRIEWAVSVPGAIPVDRYKEGVALEEAVQAIAKELMGIIGEDEVFTKANKKYLTRTERTTVTRNVLRAELRARLTAFIGHKEK